MKTMNKTNQDKQKDLHATARAEIEKLDKANKRALDVKSMGATRKR